MYVTDLKKEFYDNLVGQRVLLLVSLDVDAVCACKILQYLFQCDHIQYTLIHVNGREDLISEYRKQGKQVRHVVMINCGGTYDVLDLLEPSNEVTFYIADSHRPVDVINIYNDSQVKLLMKLDDSENVPEFEQLFRDDEVSLV
ncbi:CDC45 (predicted) [Pycnogonum litorale]